MKEEEYTELESLITERPCMIKEVKYWPYFIRCGKENRIRNSYMCTNCKRIQNGV